MHKRKSGIWKSSFSFTLFKEIRGMNKLSFCISLFLVSVSSTFSQSVVITDPKDTTTLCDYLIVTSELFLEPSKTLAVHRNTFNGDSVSNACVVTLENVYSAFGSDSLSNSDNLWYGLKWMHEHWQQPFTYILLIGDDSLVIDNTDSSLVSAGRMPSFIFYALAAYKYSDDGFTMINQQSPLYSDTLYTFPLYIGRIPCETNEQCGTYVAKVIAFDTSTVDRKWRNTIVFAADDEQQAGQKDFIPHWDPAEVISEELLPGYFTRKCYLSEFPLDSNNLHTAARENYFTTINQGALWSVYFGHGNSEQLTDEQFLRVEHVANFNNDTQPVIFCAFTSRNGDYCTPLNKSMLKQYLFSDDGGALAYIAGTGTAFATKTADFARELFTVVNDYQNLSLGKTLRKTKENETCDGNFILFGDPALSVSKPHLPLNFNIREEGTNKYILGCDFITPISSMSNYECEMTIPETTTVNQYGFVDVSFIKHIPVKTVSGQFGGTFDIPPPDSLGKVPLHISVYTWNSGYESRKDTTIFLNPISAVKHAIQAKTKPAVTITRNVIAVGFPQSFSNKQIRVGLYTCNGRKVHAITVAKATKNLRLNLDRLRLGQGAYVLRILAGSEMFVKRFVRVF